MSYRSLRVRPSGDGYVVAGDLAFHGVTRGVDLALDLNGFTKDPYGGTRRSGWDHLDDRELPRISARDQWQRVGYAGSGAGQKIRGRSPSRSAPC